MCNLKIYKKNGKTKLIYVRNLANEKDVETIKNTLKIINSKLDIKVDRFKCEFSIYYKTNPIALDCTNFIDIEDIEKAIKIYEKLEVKNLKYKRNTVEVETSNGVFSVRVKPTLRNSFLLSKGILSEISYLMSERFVNEVLG